LVCFRLPLCAHGEGKKQQGAQSVSHLSSSGTAQDRNPPQGGRARIALLRCLEEFFNFFLALEKICAYIRICRRVPKPQEKKSSAEAGAAGNFRLRRTIFAKRGNARARRENLSRKSAVMPP
jgi:hypothetical protein